jgi:hypothetical protein
LRQGIGTAQGEEAFGLLLRIRQPQVAVSTVDLAAVAVARQAAQTRAPATSDRMDSGAAQAQQPAAKRHPRPALGTPLAAPRDDIEATIAGIWADLLGLAEIGIHDDFFDLGGHSLLGTRVLAMVRARFGLELPLRLIFESSTVAAFAAVVRAGTASTDGPAIAETDREADEEVIEL